MLDKSFSAGLRFRVYSWPTLLVGLLVIKAALSLILKQSVGLVAYSNVTYFVLLLLATGVATLNAVQNTQGSRSFWALFATGCGLWSLDQWFWLYYQVGRHIKIPDSSIADPALFLHIVLLMAAVATLPHLNQSSRKPQRSILNSLLLLFLWVFLYAYLVFPHQYLSWDTAVYNFRYNILYSVENLALVLALGILALGAQPPWRSIYLHLFGASALYAISSTIANFAIDSGRYSYGDLYALGLDAAVCWFAWVPLRARQLTQAGVKVAQVDARRSKYSALWAMVVVLAISTIGVWDLFQRDQSPGLRTFRLLVVFVFIVFLAGVFFVREYFTNRELATDVDLASDQLRLAMESAKSVSWDWNLESGQVTWFGDLHTTLGIPPDTYSLDVQDFYRYIHPEDRQRVSAVLNEARQNQKPYAAEFRIVGPDGSVRWVAARGRFHYAKNGVPERMRGLAVDVTDAKRMEQKLQESEERLSGIVASAMDAIIAIDEQQRIVLFNGAAEKMFGCAADQAVGTGVDRFIPQRFRAEHQAHVQKFGESGRTNRALGALGTLCGVRANGEEFPIEASISRIETAGNKLLTIIIRDISERRRAEEVLREREERNRHLIASSHDWVWETDADGVYTYAGPQCREILGYEPAELIGKNPFDLMPPEESRRVAAIFNAIAAEHKAFRGLENTNLHKDGHLVVLETNGVPVIDEHGQFHGYRGMDRDITARKQAEDAIRESEERFRLVANTAPVLIWMEDSDQMCNYFNQPWLEFTGRPLEAELGNGWTEGVHPEDLSRCLDTYNQAFDRRESFQTQYRLRRYDGEYRWLQDIGVPRFNPDGSFAGYIGSCIDVTDRKLAEEALANMGRRLMEAHEEERTWIARELHDDINQRIALLAIELERWSQHLPESAVDLHDHIHHARQRLSDIAKDIQALSHRLHSSKLEYLGIVAAADSFCKELSEQQKVQVEFNHSDVPRTIPKEISLCLFRVLQEALQNAVKHSGDRHFHVELRTTPEEIWLTVSDAGVGFDWQDAVSRHGLGLISMRERLQLVNGEFSIESEPGRGTTIRARVPLRSAEDSVREAV